MVRTAVAGGCSGFGCKWQLPSGCEERKTAGQWVLRLVAGLAKPTSRSDLGDPLQSCRGTRGCLLCFSTRYMPSPPTETCLLPIVYLIPTALPDLDHSTRRPVSLQGLLGPGCLGTHSAYAGARGKGRRLQGSADPGSRACAPTQYSLLFEIDRGPRLAHYKPNQPPANLPRRVACLLVESSQAKPCSVQVRSSQRSTTSSPLSPDREAQRIV